MKKGIALTLAISAVMSSASIVLAQTESTSSAKMPGSRVEKRVQNIDQRIDRQNQLMNRASTTASSTMGQKMEERRTARIAKLTEARQEIIKRFAQRMFERIAAAIERHKKLADRIQERIGILKGKGVDISKSETALALARTEIANAEQALNSAKTDAQNAVGSDDPKAAFETVRTDVKNAIESVKKAHQALVNAIVALKGKSGAGTAPGTATTTSQ